MAIELSEAANWATIIGVPISLIGLVLGYRSLKSQINKTNTRIDTINEIVQLTQKYGPSGAQYHNCTFNSSPLDAKQVQNEYGCGLEQGGKDE